ncbi:MAG: DUF1488 family protein [Burkholderiales bacterium]
MGSGRPAESVQTAKRAPGVLGPSRDHAAPRFNPETSSVSFSARACGLLVQAFVTREWLLVRFGKGVLEDAGMVGTYVEHADEIDAEVARRFAHGRLEPIWLASAFSPID